MKSWVRHCHCRHLPLYSNKFFLPARKTETPVRDFDVLSCSTDSPRKQCVLDLIPARPFDVWIWGICTSKVSGMSSIIWNNGLDGATLAVVLAHTDVTGGPWTGDQQRATISTFRFFTARRYASAAYAMTRCLSVCLSQAGTVPKWLNIGSRKQGHTTA